MVFNVQAVTWVWKWLLLYFVLYLFLKEMVSKKKKESSFLNKNPFMSSFMQDTFTFFPGMKQKDFHSSFCTFRV